MGVFEVHPLVFTAIAMLLVWWFLSAQVRLHSIERKLNQIINPKDAQ